MMPTFVLALAFLSPAQSANESSAVVIDGAKLFQKAAIERVEHIVAEIRESFEIDFVIETAKQPPNLDPDKLKGLHGRAPYVELSKAARARADDLGVRGVYVLITTDPHHVTVIGWPRYMELRDEISNYKREELRKAFANIRKDKANANDVLVRTVEQYRAMLGAPHRPSPLQLWPAMVVVASVVLFWLVLILGRYRRTAPERPEPIYQPAMLGSLFGVPAGFWVHDRLFQAERPKTQTVLQPIAVVSPPPKAPAEAESVPATPTEEHL
jgi:hypothetical protein